MTPSPPISARRAAAPGRRLVPAALPMLAGLLLGACAAVGPEPQAPPPVERGGGWSLPQPGGGAAPAELAQWWRALRDPVLERLIDTALARNLDLRQSAARVDEARALRERADGGRQAAVAAGASVNRRRQSENGPLPIGRIPGLEATQTIHDIGFDAAWEIDLFGASRRSVQGAQARLDAARAEAEGVRMRVAAEVARTWFGAVGAAQELRAQQQVQATLGETLALTRQRRSAGDASAAEVDLAFAQWVAAGAALPEIEARRRAALLGLGVLLGAPPERELALLDAAPQPIALEALPLGQRADLLRRRPDVLAAEQRLAASTADIGVATAELFPKLSIAAGGGMQSLATGNWFDASSARFSVLPLISWRLFDGGRVRAEIRAREAAERQAALAYEQAVLAALGDAERALGAYQASLDTLAGRAALLQAGQRSLGHAQARWAAGDITRVELLAAERSLHEAEGAAARAHTAAAVDLVALYKALGGGWEAPAGAAAPGLASATAAVAPTQGLAAQRNAGKP